MPRRRRVRLENRLVALEAAVRGRPTVSLFVPPTDQQAIEVLTVLERAIGEEELGHWLTKRIGTAPSWLGASDTGEPEPPDDPPEDDAEA